MSEQSPGPDLHLGIRLACLIRTVALVLSCRRRGQPARTISRAGVATATHSQSSGDLNDLNIQKLCSIISLKQRDFVKFSEIIIREWQLTNKISQILVKQIQLYLSFLLIVIFCHLASCWCKNSAEQEAPGRRPTLRCSNPLQSHWLGHSWPKHDLVRDLHGGVESSSTLVAWWSENEQSMSFSCSTLPKNGTFSIIRPFVSSLEWTSLKQIKTTSWRK